MIRASVVGASGYSGSELVRLLLGHPGVELAILTASSQAGQRLDQSFPAFRGLSDATLVEADWEQLGAASDVVFLALPNGLSAAAVPELLAADARVVDIGADFRLRDVAVYEKWYGVEHPAPELLEEAVYGLPELHRDAISAARLVACPGCYPTAAALALLPVLERRRPGEAIIVDAKSGVSGRGRAANLGSHFGEINENLRPYGLGRHRHMPEMEQTYAAAGAAERVFFSPHLVPMTRGIVATCYLRLAEPISEAEAAAAFRGYYEGSPFVRVLDGELPETKATQGSNFCDVAVTVGQEASLLVGVAALDNLVKGAAGQAIQNMNLMFGLPEEEGLWQPPLYP
ncbi:MAG: N-acetyl-gamma-glutamyl-phosphate reductase [Thermoanaerobaculia bacterium]|nr:N-acetyl-gamma-glutamyl-phosphate reductase [Thermoanaerobaculia bacterium]